MESSGLRGLPADAAALHTPFLDRIFWRRSPCHEHAIVPPRPHGLDGSRPRPPGDRAASPAPPEPRSPGRVGAPRGVASGARAAGAGLPGSPGAAGASPPARDPRLGPPRAAAPGRTACWIAGAFGPCASPGAQEAQVPRRSARRTQFCAESSPSPVRRRPWGERLRIARRRARPAVPPALTSPPLMRPRRPRTLGLLLSWKSTPHEDEGRDCAGVSISQGSPRWPAYPQKLWEEDLSLTAIRRNHSC
ncbi:unnamed protein product [Nyctereutes procyonoides]|uniref:(raccoon dog) hypothetical protein n=1 Tax=Nyctereutes procyonoides TaxID=34880 RepID=A0A811ZEI2_NYCPR|nr:unnamed protein product [Nyctereutes procyonoides]